MREKTIEEARNEFIDGVRMIAKYWASVHKVDSEIDRCMGVIFSVLAMIDGVSSAFDCSVDLVLRPHPDDKAYCQENGESWFEDGMVINSDVMLHDLLYKKGE